MANLTKADAISIGEIDMIQDGSTTGTIFQQPSVHGTSIY